MTQAQVRKARRFRISRGNKKLHKTIGIFSLPAVSTCPNCRSCAKHCYARKAERIYPQVLPCRKRNLAATKDDSFVPDMIAAIREEMKWGMKAFRIHESGDFYSQEYANKWTAIMAAVPEVQFYAYTKSPYKPAALPNFNLVESILPDGDKNFGDAEYIETKKALFNFPVCPATVKGNKVTCGLDCTLCLTKANVLFHVH